MRGEKIVPLFLVFGQKHYSILYQGLFNYYSGHVNIFG